MPGSLSFRQGMAAKFSPPWRLKMWAFSIAISSSVSRQSAAKPGITTARFLTPRLGQLLHRHVGIGLEPFGPTEPRLERRHQLVLAETELFAQQPRGGDALVVIGIALARHTLSAARGRTPGSPPARNASLPSSASSEDGKRVDVEGVGIVRRRHTQRRLPAHCHNTRKASSQTVAVVAAAYCG